MKLEFKHLAAYLPYNLNVTALRKRYHNFGGITTTQKIFCVESLKMNYFSLCGYYGMYLYDDFKPILRPLSDLTKLIEVNGKKIIPVDEIFENWRNDKEMHLLSLNTLNLLKSGLYHLIEYGIINILFKYHFDVFGLIKAGLAVDINTLKNEK